MKTVAILLVAAVVYAQAIDDNEVMQKWNDFKVTFGKTYRSPVEARTRLAIFKDNLENIDAHNAKFLKGETTFSMGINQFSDWTREEFMQYVNKGISTRPKVTGETFKGEENFVAPASVDWRQQGVVTPVKDQGGCGSCWAFSTTGSIEGQLGQSGNLVSLSEQNLMDCSWDEGNYGCNGGLMTSALEYVKENGIESEEDYPYQEEDGECQASSSKIVTKISSYSNIPSGDEQALQNAVAQRGPISVAIDATWYLQSYSSGILDDPECDSSSLNHGVLVVGYGTENGVDYYIVKNSWNRSWGEAGYFRLPRNANNKCGVASMASVPQL